MSQISRYRTQPQLFLTVGGVGLVAAVIVGGCLLYDGESAVEVAIFTLATTALVSAIGASIALQRAVIDRSAGTLRYANFMTFYRWRTLRIEDIDELVYDDCKDKRKAVVSGLLIYMKRADGKRRLHRLLDHGISYLGGPSDFFRDIANAVRSARPRASISPVLLD
ncbi:hypothetical protein [Luteimonas lutimaris]|uniref:PH domain-containing protein n=1 Tax=Luteimonas lutimaris TaxID=698645 RepID=A0ABP7M661_9GAMM